MIIIINPPGRERGREEEANHQPASNPGAESRGKNQRKQSLLKPKAKSESLTRGRQKKKIAISFIIMMLRGQVTETQREAYRRENGTESRRHQPSPRLVRQRRQALQSTARRLKANPRTALEQSIREAGGIKTSKQRTHALIGAVGYMIREIFEQKVGCVNFHSTGCMIAAAAGVSDRMGQEVRKQLRKEGLIDYATHAQKLEGKNAIDGLIIAWGKNPKVAPESRGEVIRTAFDRDREEHRGSGMMLRELRSGARLGTDFESLILIAVKLLEMALDPSTAVLGREMQEESESEGQCFREERRKEAGQSPWLTTQHSNADREENISPPWEDTWEEDDEEEFDNFWEKKEEDVKECNTPNTMLRNTVPFGSKVC